MKKFASLILALALSLALCIPAFAEKSAAPGKEELYMAYMTVVEERPYLTETLEYIPMTLENFDMTSVKEVEDFADLADGIIAWQSAIPEDIRAEVLAQDAHQSEPNPRIVPGMQRVRRSQTIESGANTYTLFIYGYFDTKLDKENDRQIFNPSSCSITIQVFNRQPLHIPSGQQLEIRLELAKATHRFTLPMYMEKFILLRIM